MKKSIAIRYHECRGKDLEAYIAELAQLRMRVFRDWPYLYEGTLDFELNYLQTYLRTQESFVCLAFSGSQLVGATTAILASKEEDAFQSAFVRQGFLPERVCYFGESILLPEYRGLGVGKEFMNRRLNFARSLQGVLHCGFCAVQRPADHPLRPSSYRPLDTFWQQTGFHPVEGMLTEYSWLDVGQTQQTSKQMQFWIKPLEEKIMTESQKTQALIKSYYGAFNKRDWESFFSLLNDDVIHDLNQGPRQVGKGVFREFLAEMDRCYSEQVVELVVMVNDRGDRAAAEFVIEGTYLQSQAGLPPAQGQKYRLPVGAFFEIKEQKVQRITNYYNLNDWIKQVKA